MTELYFGWLIRNRELPVNFAQWEARAPPHGRMLYEQWQVLLGCTKKELKAKIKRHVKKYGHYKAVA